MNSWKISSQESGIKLIDFLKGKIGERYSTRHIKRLIESKSCLVNGKTERFASILLGSGDEVQFFWQETKLNVMELLKDPRRILYEDADLFVYDKPAGITSESSFLLKLKPSLELIHRLDKETSGVLMFAKTSTMKQAMIKEFQQKKINKTYLALVAGIPKQTKGIIENYLGKIAQFEGQSKWGSVKAENGLIARTDWKLAKKGNEAALVYCMPITGRTHQIRVHLSEMGHPIIGDHAYGSKTVTPFVSRCCLHALSVSFDHPMTGKWLSIEAPMPEDMLEIIQKVGIL